nr:phospholipase-like protein [Tanacetum cinerariifolium]
MEVVSDKGKGVVIKEIMEDDEVNEANPYHGDDEVEENAELFAELDDLLERLPFLNDELKENVDRIPVVLKGANVFYKNGINPSYYSITFSLADNVPKHGGIFGDCEMTLKDFLHFLGNRSAYFSARPTDVPMSVSSPAGSAANVPDEDLEMAVAALVANNTVGAEFVLPSAGRCWRGVVARPVGSPRRAIAPSSDVDSKSIEKARSSHDALCNLSYPDVQCRLDGLTLTELTNFHDMEAVRFLMSNNLLTREAHALSTEDKAMLAGRSQALREVASSGIGVELVDMKDFDLNVE